MWPPGSHIDVCRTTIPEITVVLDNAHSGCQVVTRQPEWYTAFYMFSEFARRVDGRVGIAFIYFMTASASALSQGIVPAYPRPINALHAFRSRLYVERTCLDHEAALIPPCINFS